MSTYIELVNRAEAAANAAAQSALSTANNKTIVQGLLERMQGIVGNAASLPIPTIQVDPSTGIVTAEYTATAGNVLSRTQRIGTLDISSLLVSGQGITTKFYKCASVSVPYTESHYVVTGSGTNEVNGDYHPSENTYDGYPIYTCGDAAMFYSNDYESWFITLELQNATEQDPFAFSLFQSQQITGQWETTNGTDPAPTVSLETTEHNSAKTWTGYKAVKDSTTGIYRFETTATSGLTYGNGITPQVGGVYNADATIAATLYQGDSLNIPDLVFYAPLSEAAAYAVTGQAISGSADAYAIVQGVPCARFSSSTSYLSASDSALPHGNIPVAVSCWLNYSVVPSDFSAILTYGNNQSFGQTIAFTDWNSVLFSGTNGVNALTDVTPSIGTWYHFLSVYDGNGTITNYVNGIVSGQPLSSNLNISTGNIKIAPTEVSRDIYVASVRIYNRVPTPSEIAALANEFTPARV